jgi:hypothetical protein
VVDAHELRSSAMPMIQLTARVQALTPDGRESIQRELTEADAPRVWVLIHEQVEGTWGAGGGIVRYADVVALAQLPEALPERHLKPVFVRDLPGRAVGTAR